jgi:choline dehydrogenase-like flavoprotein
MSDALGRYITIHPALTVYGIYPSPIKNYRGFPKTYYTPRFSKSNHYYIETAFYYPFISTKHLGLWGKTLKEVMRCYPRFMSAIILNHDEAKPQNRITLKNGSPVLNYKISKETVRALAHAQAQTTRIFFSAGCEKAVMPFAKNPVFGKEIPDSELEDFISEKGYVPNLAPLATAHPQGGARMGTDPRSSVTDPFGQVHGYPWLYVADASLFPKSSHVNPYMTIMALAERVAEKILEKERVKS